MIPGKLGEGRGRGERERERRAQLRAFSWGPLALFSVGIPQSMWDTPWIVQQGAGEPRHLHTDSCAPLMEGRSGGWDFSALWPATRA